MVLENLDLWTKIVLGPKEGNEIKYLHLQQAIVSIIHQVKRGELI